MANKLTLGLAGVERVNDLGEAMKITGTYDNRYV